MRSAQCTAREGVCRTGCVYVSDGYANAHAIMRMHACMYACARVLAEAPSFMITCMHACMLACNLTRLVVCMFVLVVYLLCIHAYNIDAASMHPCIRACMHAFLHSGMHAYFSNMRVRRCACASHCKDTYEYAHVCARMRMRPGARRYASGSMHMRPGASASMHLCA